MRRPGVACGKLEYFYKGAEGKPVVFIARDCVVERRHQSVIPKARHSRIGRLGRLRTV